MKSNNVTELTAIVVGASRGLGRGIATAVAQAGASVLAVSRSERALLDLAAAGSIRPAVADATDPTVAGGLLDLHEPDVVVLVAGAAPLVRPLQHHTWATFSVNWETDVRMTFNWVREALLRPLAPGSRVIVMSSGAALQGSPLSGGYAGAKATQRFITAYAQEESDRNGLGISFTAILPRITPVTDLGRPAVRAYAARGGQTEEQYMARMGALVTPEATGAAVVELIRTDAERLSPAYLLTGEGLRPLTQQAPPVVAGED